MAGRIDRPRAARAGACTKPTARNRGALAPLAGRLGPASGGLGARDQWQSALPLSWTDLPGSGTNSQSYPSGRNVNRSTP